MQIRDWYVDWYFFDVTTPKCWNNYPIFESGKEDDNKESFIDSLRRLAIENDNFFRILDGTVRLG